MKVLSIESSCDETAAAVLGFGDSVAGDFDADFAEPGGAGKSGSSRGLMASLEAGDFELLSNVVVSQIDIFKEYGGVIPEVAARSHLEAILPVVHKALSDAGADWEGIDAIAVTHTPGLLGSLLIGTLTARTLAILHQKPLYAVHHLKSHIYSAWLPGGKAEMPASGQRSRPPAVAGGRADRLRFAHASQGANVVTASGPGSRHLGFPILALVVSGGHTQIIWMPGANEFEIVGTTRDDAVGECFDKVAKILGLPYPGGPAIAEAALSGDAGRYRLPHPKVEGFDFSFSGLKTAVLRAVQGELGLPINHPSHDLKNHLSPGQVADFAASFQATAVEILAEKLEAAERKYAPEAVVVAGGVSANEALRKRLPGAVFPERKFAGDNAAMVAMAAAYEIAAGVAPTDPYHLDIMARSEIR